jgi:hypothetical protein
MELATLPRELESGVVEWEHPYEWHRHGPPIPPCQEDRMTTVRAIVPGGYADPPHYPKLGGASYPQQAPARDSPAHASHEPFVAKSS